jgi:hypothetical protein
MSHWSFFVLHYSPLSAGCIHIYICRGLYVYLEKCHPNSVSAKNYVTSVNPLRPVQ